MPKAKYAYFDIFRVFFYIFIIIPGTSLIPVCDGGCGRQQYRNKFEGAELQLCSHLKDSRNLKKVLLYSAGVNKNSDKKILNL